MIPAEFHPAAQADLLAAIEFYEGRAPGLGRAFLLEAERTAALLQQFPAIGPVVDGDLRRFWFNRFPYSYLYRLPGECVRILAVAHHKQKPGHGFDRR